MERLTKMNDLNVSCNPCSKQKILFSQTSTEIVVLVFCAFGLMIVLPINLASLIAQSKIRRSLPDFYRMMLLMGVAIAFKSTHGFVKIGSGIIFNSDFDAVFPLWCTITTMLDYCASAIISLTFIAISVQRCFIIIKPAISFSSKIWICFSVSLSLACLGSVLASGRNYTFTRKRIVIESEAPFKICVKSEQVCIGSTTSAGVSSEIPMTVFIMGAYMILILLAHAITQLTTYYLLKRKRFKPTGNTNTRLHFAAKLQILSDIVFVVFYVPWYIYHVLLATHAIPLNHKNEALHLLMCIMAYYTYSILFQILICASKAHRSAIKTACAKLLLAVLGTDSTNAAAMLATLKLNQLTKV